MPAFSDAFVATCTKRETLSVVKDGRLILNEVSNSKEMKKLWSSYQKKFSYATDITWTEVMKAIISLYQEISQITHM